MAKKTAQAEKPQRTRGAYPYYAMKACLKLGNIVRSAGGERVGVPKSMVADALDVDQGSSTFVQMVASAKTFGIVDGNTELRLTPLGKDYYSPMTPMASRLAELEFFRQPIAFAYLIDRFDGGALPAASMLGNILGRDCKLSESWKSRVAQMFVSTANDLGVLDQAGRLRYDSALQQASRGIVPPGTAGQVALDEAQPDRATALVEAQVYPALATTELIAPSASKATYRASDGNIWQFTEGDGTVRLETPETLTRSLWERLKKYVDILEPTD